MSEGILKALMQLFALVAAPWEEEGSRRNIVRNYLSQHLNSQLIEEYLDLFDYHQNIHRERLKEKDKAPKRYAANSVKVLRISTGINEELTHYQKMVVIIQLLEFINSGNQEITTLELEFVLTVAQTFNIDPLEYEQIRDFILYPGTRVHNNLLTIGCNKQLQHDDRYLLKEFISARILVLNVSSASLFLFKPESVNDLTVNGQLLLPNRIHFLRPGSSIRHKRNTPITYSDIALHFNQQANESPIVYEVNDVVFSFRKKEIGLQPLNFVSCSGQLVGIMGDSGAGKSTLVNLLTGILKPSSGEVNINGISIHQNPEKLKGLIGYVAQDDLLIEDLSVYQNLYYNARLCFGHLKNDEIHNKVEGLLIALGLYEIRHMKVGSIMNKKISGGQRKRLNIALELIREPSVMFLDEPTSGLSSRDSENIMDLLKELTAKGKLIYVVIHQPSSEIFKMFNQLLVLDNGGYLIYDGDPVAAVNYFKSCINHVNRDESECPVCGNVNPEQILNIINAQVLDEYGSPTSARRITPAEWFNTFKTKVGFYKKEKPKTLPLPSINFNIPKRRGQFLIFFLRDVMAKFSNRQYLIINFFEAPFLALILASLLFYFNPSTAQDNTYIFYNNPNLTVYLIISVIIAIFVGLSVSAEEIISDKKILKREAFLNLSRFSYLLSKIAILAILSAIQTALFVLIGNNILQIQGMFWHYWLILFSSSVFANLLGLNISDSLKKTVNIYILIPFLIIPQLILSGVFVSYDQLNPKISSSKGIPWYGELITAKWAFEALAVHQYLQNDYQRLFVPFESLKSKAIYGKDFLIPAISEQLEMLGKETDPKRRASIRNLIYNEITSKNLQLRPDLKYPNPEVLHTESIDSATLENLSEHLKTLKTFYINLYNQADQKEDAYRQRLTAAHPSKEGNYLSQLRDKHHNEGLERFIRGTDNFFSNRIIQQDDHFYQKFDPIYQYPEHSFIKAQFLSPIKRIGNLSIDTFWADLMVIWVINLVLFVSLYARILNKILTIGKRLKKGSLKPAIE